MALARFDAFFKECHEKFKRINELIPELEPTIYWDAYFAPQLQKKRSYYCREEFNRDMARARKAAEYNNYWNNIFENFYSNMFNSVVEASRQINRQEVATYFQIPYTFTKEDIAQAFRKKALEHHPDRNGDPLKFREAVEYRELALKLASS